jgi:hypothetical protein
MDGGDIRVEWQWKSQAFMEIVTLKGFSIDARRTLRPRLLLRDSASGKALKFIGL